MSQCKRCGKNNQKMYKYCLGCGTELDLAEPPPDERPAATALPARKGTARLCEGCGQPLPADFAFCGQCGAPAATGAARIARMVLIRPDGSEGGVHPLREGENLIGRQLGPLFVADGYLSPRHACITLTGATARVRDAGSLNGVFVRLTEEEELTDGDIFRVGQELLRFDALPPPLPLEDGTDIMGSPNPGYWGRLCLIVGRDEPGPAFPLFGDAVVLGRERGDILFPEDGYVSGQHARVSQRQDHFYLADLDSSNGSFIRLRGERSLRAGASLLIGQQLFRVDF